MPDTICWFCGKSGAKRREHASGKFYREPACDDCFADMKKSGYAVKDNTPMPAAQLLALADEMADALDAVAPLVSKAYRAARAASPRTLEEALMIGEALAFGRVTGDDDGTSEWAIECRMARQRHARRLAGEGGGK